jgi:high-affinity iron transporter
VLSTLVIGLREGLEAALIIGIIAAFLRRNGRSLAPMWIGVFSAVGLSVVIGVLINVVVHELPQRPQEMMETVIGLVAILLVTGMVLWMGSHARSMRRDLEAHAASALSEGTSTALAVMAFLAVLKEGFETSVFLLATFQHATNALEAALGVLLGILGALALGYGLYKGGISLNLGRFFKATSVFLILVAAGLVVTTLRTAHEAGWINGGQSATVDLSWLAPGGSSVQGALVTGVLGIPPHPVAIQVVAWFAYVVPMMLLLLWPARRRISTAAGLRVRAGIAGLMLAAAGLLAVMVTPPVLPDPGPAPLVAGESSDVGAAGPASTGPSPSRSGTAEVTGDRLTLTVGGATRTEVLTGGVAGDRYGVAATRQYTVPLSAAVAGLPASVTRDDLFVLGGNRFPVGISATNAGPFDAIWVRTGVLDVWVVGDTLLDLSGRDALTLTVSGGGLTGPRTITVARGASLPGGQTATGGSWHVDPVYVARVKAAQLALGADRMERAFWGRTVPVVLLVGAALVLARGRQIRRREVRGAAGAVAARSVTAGSAAAASGPPSVDPEPAVDPAPTVDPDQSVNPAPVTVPHTVH